MAQAKKILRKEGRQQHHIPATLSPLPVDEPAANPDTPHRDTPRIVIKPRKPSLEGKRPLSPTLPIGKQEKYPQMAFMGFGVPEEIPEGKGSIVTSPPTPAKEVWEKGEDPDTLDQSRASNETDLCPFLGERCLGPRCMLYSITQTCSIPELSRQLTVFESKVDGFQRYMIQMLQD